MKRLVATAMLCALLGSCATVRRHPRIATMTMVSLTAAVITTVTVNGGCTSQPGDECSLAQDAPLIAVTTIGGAVAGYFLYDAAAEPPASPEVWSPVAPLPRGTSIARPATTTPIDAPPPPTWIIPWSLPTAPLGRITYRRAARADSVGLMAACISAKRAVFDGLERACRAKTTHVGVAAHVVATTPCACEETRRGHGCFTRGEASCAQIPDDLAVLGTGSAATRVLAEATATLEARRACWAVGATAQPAVTACECDATLGAISQTCGCIATADCGP